MIAQNRTVYSSHIRMVKTVTFLPRKTEESTITSILMRLTNTSVKGVGCASAYACIYMKYKATKHMSVLETKIVLILRARVQESPPSGCALVSCEDVSYYRNIV